MFSELIVTALPELVKFFDLLGMNFYFTPTQNKHFQAFIVAMMMRGFGGKMNDVSELSLHTHRTSSGRFLDSDAWNDKHLLYVLNKHVIGTIWQMAMETKQPIYVLIDDTICEKAIPGSKVKQPIYGCGFHKSHLKNKMVYGHQFVGVMLRCGDLVLPFNIVLYDKTKSKIDIAKDIIASLPKPPFGGFVVADSWYSCKALFEASRQREYHFIGAVKSNRLIFPRGFRKKGVKIGVFARSLKLSDFDFVKAGGHGYHVYTYLGKINGQRKVKIIITWPKGSFGNPKTMKAFISTDIEMNPKQLIKHYMKRWPIEVFFREANRSLGMKHCQVRSQKAIVRYQYILMLSYCFCTPTIKDNTITFGKQRRKLQRAIERFRITWVYEQAKKGVSLNSLILTFNAA